MERIEAEYIITKWQGLIVPDRFVYIYCTLFSGYSRRYDTFRTYGKDEVIHKERVKVSTP